LELVEYQQHQDLVVETLLVVLVEIQYLHIHALTLLMAVEVEHPVDQWHQKLEQVVLVVEETDDVVQELQVTQQVKLVIHLQLQVLLEDLKEIRVVMEALLMVMLQVAVVVLE
tara:strand:+ start:33 stop:371 length:339 start_codon:yes stop_codon:yes gene_type:complete